MFAILLFLPNFLYFRKSVVKKLRVQSNLVQHIEAYKGIVSRSNYSPFSWNEMLISHLRNRKSIYYATQPSSNNI